jgi:hypothetical protein
MCSPIAPVTTPESLNADHHRHPAIAPSPCEQLLRMGRQVVPDRDR